MKGAANALEWPHAIEMGRVQRNQRCSTSHGDPCHFCSAGIKLRLVSCLRPSSMVRSRSAVALSVSGDSWLEPRWPSSSMVRR